MAVRWSDSLGFVLILPSKRLISAVLLSSGAAFLFVLVKNILGAMDDAQDVDLVWFDVIDDAVWPLDHFSNVVHFVLRHFASGERKISDLL